MEKLTLLMILFTLSLATSSAMACDNKRCEKAYLASTHEYVKNYGRRANSAKSERQAYARLREKRDYAGVSHLRRIHHPLKNQTRKTTSLD